MDAHKKAKKKLKVRIYPKAIVILTKGNLSYAEIQKEVKVDPDLKDLGGDVRKIRRIQKSDLMFELKKSTLAKLKSFVTKLRTH